MEIKQSGSQPSAKGPAEFFTGNVRIDPLFPATDPSCVSAGLVTFEPGARTAWHTHPLGQRLIVTAGCGWVQCWGGPKREIRAGDVVVCPSPGAVPIYRSRTALPRVELPVTLNEQTRGLALAKEVIKYYAQRRGVLTFTAAIAHGFVRTRPGLAVSVR